MQLVIECNASTSMFGTRDLIFHVRGGALPTILEPSCFDFLPVQLTRTTSSSSWLLLQGLKPLDRFAWFLEGLAATTITRI